MVKGGQSVQAWQKVGLAKDAHAASDKLTTTGYTHTTHIMSRIPTFGRAVSQLATPNVSSTTCRSCQLRLSAASQQRQLQTSATRPAIADRFKSVFGGKKKEEDSADLAAAERAELDDTPRKPDFPGWYLPKENLPEGWAKTPEEDKEYVMASEGKDLEHVGSDKWLEQQFDDKPKYKGYEAQSVRPSQRLMLTFCRWAKVRKTNTVNPKDAGEQVLKAAKQAGLKVDQQGLDYAVTEVKDKFKVCGRLSMTIDSTSLT